MMIGKLYKQATNPVGIVLINVGIYTIVVNWKIGVHGLSVDSLVGHRVMKHPMCFSIWYQMGATCISDFLTLTSHLHRKDNV